MVVAAIAFAVGMQVAGSIFGQTGTSAKTYRKRANRAAMEIDKINEFNERVQALREGRMQVADVQNQAAVGGIQGSSVENAVLGGIVGSTSRGLTVASQIHDLQRKRMHLLGKADAASQRQANIQSAFNFVGTIGSIYGGGKK